MKVTRITATVRKAREVQGGWYTVELGAEADLTDEESESWEEHQADLVKLIREDVASAMMGRRPPTRIDEGHRENSSNPVPAETTA